MIHWILAYKHPIFIRLAYRHPLKTFSFRTIHPPWSCYPAIFPYKEEAKNLLLLRSYTASRATTRSTCHHLFFDNFSSWIDIHIQCLVKGKPYPNLNLCEKERSWANFFHSWICNRRVAVILAMLEFFRSQPLKTIILYKEMLCKI